MKAESLETKDSSEDHDVDSSIEWGVASLNLPGHTESGDQFLVKAHDEGVLLAVVDGLGHGRGAASTAKAALRTLESHASLPVSSLINLCHKELGKTRGAVMTLASLNTRENAVTWIAVGNVMAVLLRIDSRGLPLRESVLMSGGVVGYRLPSLHESVVPISKGDVLILATDGIREAFVGETSTRGHPGKMADKILAQYAKGTDEGLVFVARYKGYQA